MERDDMYHFEFMAMTVEHGSRRQRRALLDRMAADPRLCERVVVGLRSMMLFNKKTYENEVIR